MVVILLHLDQVSTVLVEIKMTWIKELKTFSIPIIVIASMLIEILRIDTLIPIHNILG